MCVDKRFTDSVIIIYTAYKAECFGDWYKFVLIFTQVQHRTKTIIQRKQHNVNESKTTFTKVFKDYLKTIFVQIKMFVIFMLNYSFNIYSAKHRFTAPPWPETRYLHLPNSKLTHANIGYSSLGYTLHSVHKIISPTTGLVLIIQC